MKKALEYIILIANLVAVISLIGAFITPMINPTRLPYLGFFGLIMPYSLIINVCFICYWILKARLYLFISLIAIIVSWSTVKTSFAYHHSSNPQVEQEALKVISYNVRVFDRYNWNKDENTVTEMLKFIKDEKADVLCFQEFGTSKSGKYGVTESYILNSLQEFPYHHIHYAPKSLHERHQYGLAIFSKYPMSARNRIGDANHKEGSAIYADIKVNGNKIRIINSHFESIHLDGKYDITEGINGENYKNRIKVIIKSLGEAATQHEQSTNEINKIIEETLTPVILCADMNNTPVSHSYHTLMKTLEDSFLDLGRGFGATYNGLYPFLRIDYILHSKELKTVNYRRTKVHFSDHYPICSYFNIE